MKKSVLFFVFVVFAMILASCGGAATPTADAPTTDAPSADAPTAAAPTAASSPTPAGGGCAPPGPCARPARRGAEFPALAL